MLDITIGDFVFDPIDAVVDTSLTHVPSSLLPARSQSEPIPR